MMRTMIKELLFLLGALLARILPHRNDSELFLFFPFYHVGGAERVHADILKVVSDKKPWIIVTNSSVNQALRGEFSRHGKLLDLSWPAGRAIPQAVLNGYLAGCINGCRNPVLFGSNSSYYYQLLPRLDAKVRCVDLIHAFGGGLETVSLPHVGRLDRRVVISQRTREDLADLYREHGVPAALAERIDVVENKVAVPGNLVRDARGDNLRVLYVGRGSREKRAHLVGRIARRCHERGVPAEFTLVGELSDAFPAAGRAGLRFLGELHDQAEIERIYRQSDLLLVTSSREGFPMVIMEAMAHAVVPLATDVGGISRHLINGENGHLVANSADEEEIVEGFASLIAHLHDDRGLLERLSGTAYRYAASHFQGQSFDRYYRDLFEFPGSSRPETPGVPGSDHERL